MTVQTTSNLSNSITAVYKEKYLEGARQLKLYDQVAIPYTDLGADGKDMAALMRGSSINVPFLSDMTPGTSAIPETADVTAQTLTDATKSVTWSSRYGALQWSQQLTIEAYTDYTARAYERVGANAMESIEFLAIQAALAGTWVERAAARASLDAGTPSHYASDKIFSQYDGQMQSLRVPGYVDGTGGTFWSAIMHPFSFHDIRESGQIEAIGDLAQPGIHLNWELGQIGRFRLLVSPYAKVFGAAGADAASNVATTLSAAASALDTTISVNASIANRSTSLFGWVGTEETSTTFYSTNEPYKYVSGTTTATILGQGANGGLRFPHAVSTAVRNADSVYPILFAGPRSLVKVFATDVGEMGQTVGPKTSGMIDHLYSLGWKFYGGYAVVSDNWVLRFEGSTSYEA